MDSNILGGTAQHALTVVFDLYPPQKIYFLTEKSDPILSRISWIISVEKILLCGEFSDFCKEFEQFMAFYRNLCRFCSKYV